MFLDNFSTTKHSDNRHLYLKCGELNKLVIGGNCLHRFYLPFNYEECIESGEVIYKQGFDIIGEPIVIKSAMISYKPKLFCSTISINLGPSFTQLFKPSYLDAYCQLRLVTKTGEVLYDKPYKVTVLEPLQFIPVN